MSVNRLDRRFRVVLLSLSIVCALIPAVALILAVDMDYRRAASAHDSAIVADAASQISLRIRSVKRQLEAVRALDGANPSGSAIHSFLRAIQSSDSDLIKVGFVARKKIGGSRTDGGTPELDRAPLPVYHAMGGRPYVTVTVPFHGEGTAVAAVLDGQTVTRRLRSLADRPGVEAYLFTTGGRLLASSGTVPPQVSSTLLVGERPAQRVVTASRRLGNVRALRYLGAATWYVTETPIPDTNWVLLLEHAQHGLLSPRFPVVFTAAAVLFAAVAALLALLLLPRSFAGPTKRRLEDAVRRNEILIRETHHRVKNDLQILSSILHLSDQPGIASGEHEILTESQNRVNAISLIHELLCKTSDLAAGVNMRVYVSELIRRIEASLLGDSEAVSIVSSVGDFFFDGDTSVACGLLLNELLTNSLKYAFPNGGGGVILVRMERVASGRYLMQVQDDGVGLPKECWIAKGGSLGMQLVRALTEQLGGTVSVESDTGTSWRILFDVHGDAVAACSS